MRSPDDTRFQRRRLIDQLAMREVFKFYLEHTCDGLTPVVPEVREIIEEAITELNELIAIRKRDPEQNILIEWLRRRSPP